MCLFFKQKTAYEMRINDWSSDVCSSDLLRRRPQPRRGRRHPSMPHRDGQGAPVPCQGAAAQRGPGPGRRDRRAGGREAMIYPPDHGTDCEIGRAPGWHRVVQYVWTSVVLATIKKKTHNTKTDRHS